MPIRLSNNSNTLHAIQELEDISGVNLHACYQCGNCSAGCPCIAAMDILPHKIIRMSQLGQFDQLADARTIWVCAACMTCSARCPRGVDIAAVMEALRTRILCKRASSDYVRQADIDADMYEELPQIAIINNFRKLTQ